MKRRILNSMTALVVAGICFGCGGALILGGFKVDKRQKEARQLAAEAYEKQVAAEQKRTEEQEQDGAQLAENADEEVSISEVYPPLSAAPEEAGTDKDDESILWLSLEEGEESHQETLIEDGETPKAAVIEDYETPLAGEPGETVTDRGNDKEIKAGVVSKSSSEEGTAQKKTADDETLIEIDDNQTPLSDFAGMPEASGVSVEQNGETVIDYSNTSDGYIMVNWTGDSGAKVKVLLKDPAGITYQYDLHPGSGYETFPLTSGNGNYNVGIYKNISGTKYSTVLTKDIAVSLSSELAPYLRPNQFVNYNGQSAAVSKAAGLCSGKANVLDKVAAVYDYVINNLTYDKHKAQTVQSGYLPVVDETLSTGTGICFDYSSLMAAMLRSQNVPTKLVIGYAKQAYHAWINVWSEEEGWIEQEIHFDGNTWKLMDPTFASTGGQSDSVMQYIGNGKNYRPKYQY